MGVMLCPSSIQSRIIAFWDGFTFFSVLFIAYRFVVSCFVVLADPARFVYPVEEAV
jgi:hypothetical protein